MAFVIYFCLVLAFALMVLWLFDNILVIAGIICALGIGKIIYELIKVSIDTKRNK